MKYSLIALLSLCFITSCNTIAGVGRDLSTLGSGMKGFGDNSRKKSSSAYEVDTAELATSSVTEPPAPVTPSGAAYSPANTYSSAEEENGGFKFNIREYD